MAKSPVWDKDTGFGGNGNENADESVGKGHCVTDGPFANLTVQYFSAKREPHCLSHGFPNGEILDQRFGNRVRPHLIELSWRSLTTIYSTPDWRLGLTMLFPTAWMEISLEKLHQMVSVFQKTNLF